MEPQEQKVVSYRTETGKLPFEEWFRSLRDVKTRAIILARLARIRLGNFGDCKAISEGIQELRINYGPVYRSYFGKDRDRVVLLLCGGDKSTQAIDIEKAKQYWQQYKAEQANS